MWTMRTTRLWAMWGLIMSLALSGLGAFDYDAYHPYKLADVIKEQASTRVGDWNIVGAEFKYRISVSFSGEIRPIDPKIRTLIGMWLKSTGRDAQKVDLFAHEAKVTEGDVAYWLPG